MDDQIFTTRMQSIHDDILRLNNAAFAMEASNRMSYPDKFLEFSIDTAIRAERIACKFRHLIGQYGMIRKEPLMERIAESHGISISENDRIITVSIPRLLPKWKKPRSREFINQPLYYAISKYCNEHKTIKLRECAICFVHIYDEKLSLGRIRDYDNLEMKNILDTIATFFMTDDSGLLCDVYNTTKLGDSDCTQVYVMPQERLSDFVSKLKNS